MEQSITADEEMRDLRIATIAVTLSNMRPQEAAERLERLPVEDIGAILLQIERARERGAILGELEPELATEALEYMQSHDGK